MNEKKSNFPLENLQVISYESPKVFPKDFNFIVSYKYTDGE
jgi:hypothetical protein